MLRPLLLLLVLTCLPAAEEPTASAVLAAHGALLAGPVASGTHPEAAIAAAFHHQLFGLEAPRRDHPPVLLRHLMESGGRDGQAVLDRGWYELGVLVNAELDGVVDRLHQLRLEAMRAVPSRARVIGLVRMWRHAPLGPAKARWASLVISACYWGAFDAPQDPISAHDFRQAIAGIGNNPGRLFHRWSLDPVPEPQRTEMVRMLWQTAAWLDFHHAPDAVLLRHLRVGDLVDPDLRPALHAELVGHQVRVAALLDHLERMDEAPPPALLELAGASPLDALLAAATAPDAAMLARVVDGLLADRIESWDWFGSDGYRDLPTEAAPMSSLVPIPTWHRLWRSPGWRTVGAEAEARLASAWPHLPPATRGALTRVLQPVLAADGPVLVAARADAEPRLRLLAAQLDLERDPDAWRPWCAALLALEPAALQACGRVVQAGLKTLRQRLGEEPVLSVALREVLAASLAAIAEQGEHWTNPELLLALAEVAPQLDLGPALEASCCSLAVSDRGHGNPWILTRLARALLTACPPAERNALLARVATLNPMLEAELRARCGELDAAEAYLTELDDQALGRLPDALEALFMARDFDAYARSSWTHPGLWQPWRGPGRPAWAHIGDWTEAGDDDHLLIGQLTRRLAGAEDQAIQWRKVWTEMDWLDALAALAARDLVRTSDRAQLGAMLARGDLGLSDIRPVAQLIEILRDGGAATLAIPTVGASEGVLIAAAELAFQEERYAEAAVAFAAVPGLRSSSYGIVLVRCLMAHALAGIEPPSWLHPAALAPRGGYAVARVARWHAGRGEVEQARRWLAAVTDPNTGTFHARCLRWRLDLASGDQAAARTSLAAARRASTHPSQDRYLDTLAALTADADDPVVQAWAAAARDDISPGGDGERGARAEQLADWLLETGSAALGRQLAVELALIDQAAGRRDAAREAWFALSSGDDWWADLGGRWATALISTQERLRVTPALGPAVAHSPWTALIGVELDPAAGPPVALLEDALLVFPDGRPHPIDDPGLVAPYQGWRRVVTGWLPLVEPGAYGFVTRVDGVDACLTARIAPVAAAPPQGRRRAARP